MIKKHGAKVPKPTDPIAKPSIPAFEDIGDVKIFNLQGYYPDIANKITNIGKQMVEELKKENEDRS